jgi:hypothetical protein
MSSKIFFRNMRTLIAMFLMDTNLPQNANIIGILRKEVLGSNLLEVFLESAPQFILQAYIILKTGNASKYCFFMKLCPLLFLKSFKLYEIRVKSLNLNFVNFFICFVK